MISVLICSRNRASSLHQTLEAMLSQHPSVNFEIVVVDNGSKDRTPQVIEEFISQYPDLVRYHFEGQAGLSQARNAGLKVVAGNIIAFTDDDVLVAENWLDEIQREFAADQNLGVLIGRVLLANSQLQPVGIQESLEERTFASPEQAVESAYNTVIGANMVFRREIFERCGDYDVRLGAGKFFAACEDLDMACRAMKAGFKMKYAPNVVVYHNHDRVSLKQACRLQYNYGKGYAAYLVKHILNGDKHALRVAYWSGSRFIRRMLGRDKHGGEENRYFRAHWRGVWAALLPALLRMR